MIDRIMNDLFNKGEENLNNKLIRKINIGDNIQDVINIENNDDYEHREDVMNYYRYTYPIYEDDDLYYDVTYLYDDKTNKVTQIDIGSVYSLDVEVFHDLEEYNLIIENILKYLINRFGEFDKSTTNYNKDQELMYQKQITFEDKNIHISFYVGEYKKKGILKSFNLSFYE